MAGNSKPPRRSGCPLSISLEVLGDRWSLLIVRDLMVRGYHTFKEFEASGEGIATNILANRLQRLAATGIICLEADEKDRRRLNYWLTEKGIDLAPVLLEMFLWGDGTRIRAHPALCWRKWKTTASSCSRKRGGAGENVTRLRCCHRL